PKSSPPYIYPPTTLPKPGHPTAKAQTWYFTWPAHYPKLDNGLPVPPPGAITDPAPLPPSPGPAAQPPAIAPPARTAPPAHRPPPPRPPAAPRPLPGLPPLLLTTPNNPPPA